MVSEVATIGLNAKAGGGTDLADHSFVIDSARRLTRFGASIERELVLPHADRATRPSWPAPNLKDLDQ